MRKSIPKKLFSLKSNPISISQSNRQKGSIAPTRKFNKPRPSKVKSKNNSSPQENIKHKQKQKTQTLLSQSHFPQLKAQFDTVILKVFSLIDIFSRGFISEANINSLVPQPAYYFLGGVFQKIKMGRKSLNKIEFQSECRKLFQRSTEEDIREFIQKISYVQVKDLKISEQDVEKNEIKESHVEDRYSLPFDGNTSFRKNFTKNIENTISFQKIEEENNENPFTVARERMNLTPLTEIDNFYKGQNMAELKKNKQHRNIDKNEGNLEVTDYFTCHDGLTKSPNFKNERNIINDDRLDKLSLKLENFIKQNSKRLQLSKNVREDD